ncbi:MAG: hypothetical protein K2G24_04400, partial [Muribaculaceae bacterium]|nr:hypothetical protein [Muribaculaceae bacterium]
SAADHSRTRKHQQHAATSMPTLASVGIQRYCGSCRHGQEHSVRARRSVNTYQCDPQCNDRDDS